MFETISSARSFPLLRAALAALVVLLAMALTLPLAASSHREAPGITRSPQVDGTDFYMFRSYEPGREGYVTLIANYNPLQDPYGGPNYFPLDGDAFYNIHIDNDGDAIEDISFAFRFSQNSPFIALDVGPAGATQSVPVPLINVGPAGPGFGLGALNMRRFYTLRTITGEVTNPTSVQNATVAGTGSAIFGMPLDNIGNKSFPNYEAYANIFVTDLNIPGCSPGDGRIFVGQRKDSFAVNLGETFDLVNLNPLGPVDGERSDTENKNVTSIILEVPTSCLTGGNGDVIGGWTTAWLPRTRVLTDDPTFDDPDLQGGPFMQVSRLANPLANEVAIGLPDKNRFNASHPQNDGTDPAFATYVTHPTLPELLQILFGVEAPNNFPRNDLVWVFLTGIPGVNENGSVAEMMRLNTAIPPTPRAMQHNLGVAAGDNAGYPNGRRPGDDTVDISLRAVMGLLCHLNLGVCEPTDAPAGLLPLTDGAIQNAMQFSDAFPYLSTPIPGSPN